MVVEEPIIDLHGTVLLQKSTVITQNSIKLLRMWGVLEASIDDESASQLVARDITPVAPEVIEGACSIIALLFQHTNQKDPFVAELMRLATNRIVQSKAGQT